MATATTAKPSLSYFLNNPCHNCRRRRLRCDRSRPSCNKCSASGRECLGYDKLFVWTPCAGTGPGSKGSSGTPTPPAVTTPGAIAPAATTAAGVGVGVGVGAGAGGRADARRVSTTGRCSSRSETRSATNSPTSSSSSPSTLRGSGTFSVVSFSGFNSPARPHAVSTRPLKIERAESTEDEAGSTGSALICMPTTLTDPLFKDLDHMSRRYLSHCLCLISLCLSSPSAPGLDLVSYLPCFILS